MFIGNPIELFSSILSFAYHVVLYVIFDNVALINSTQIVREILFEKIGNATGCFVWSGNVNKT